MDFVEYKKSFFDLLKNSLKNDEAAVLLDEKISVPTASASFEKVLKFFHEGMEGFVKDKAPYSRFRPKDIMFVCLSLAQEFQEIEKGNLLKESITDKKREIDSIKKALEKINDKFSSNTTGFITNLRAEIDQKVVKEKGWGFIHTYNSSCVSKGERGVRGPVELFLDLSGMMLKIIEVDHVVKEPTYLSGASSALMKSKKLKGQQAQERLIARSFNDIIISLTGSQPSDAVVCELVWLFTGTSIETSDMKKILKS